MLKIAKRNSQRCSNFNHQTYAYTSAKGKTYNMTNVGLLSFRFYFSFTYDALCSVITLRLITNNYVFI